MYIDIFFFWFSGFETNFYEFLYDKQKKMSLSVKEKNTNEVKFKKIIKINIVYERNMRYYI